MKLREPLPKLRGAVFLNAARAIFLCAAFPAGAEVTYPYELPSELSATIEVNTKVKTPFNNLLLGLNCNWPEGQYGLQGYNNPVAQNLIRTFKPSSLRWPHGVWANVYDWEVDGRRMYDDYKTEYRSGVEKHPELRYGFPGLHSLHQELKFDVLFVWNINYDSPEKGVRRLLDRRAKGFDMKWIELGNETFWKNQRSNAVSDVQKYIEVTKAHAAALKAVAPDVKLSVNVTWREASNGTWNQPLMAEHYFDAVTLHKYVTPGETPDGIKEALNARKLILDTAETIRRDFPRRPIWLSEWAVDCGNNAISIVGMTDIYLGIFARPDLFEIADYFQLNAAEALVRYDKATGIHTKTSYGAAYEIVRDVFENSERYESRVKSTAIAEGLDAVNAEVVIKDGKVIVFAVNKANRSVPFSVKLDGAPCTQPLKHRAFAFENVNAFPSFGLEESALTDVTPKSGGLVLPPLSINRIEGLSIATTPIETSR